MALPKRDAYLLGQWSDQCGYVVFAWDHGYVSGYYGQWKGIARDGCSEVPLVFGAHHGGFVPTQSHISSSFGSFLIDERGLKRDTRSRRKSWATSMPWTLCRPCVTSSASIRRRRLRARRPGICSKGTRWQRERY